MEININLNANEITKINIALNALIEREKLFAKIFKNDYGTESDEMITELEFIKSKLVKDPINDKANYSPQINREYCGTKGSDDVLNFIQIFLAHQNSGNADTILKNQFNTGYCYHFAAILKATFDRGEICWCAPYGHLCWVDDDGVPYDIYGICISEADYFIPVKYLGDKIKDFLHIPGKSYNATKEDLQDIIDKYLEDHKCRYKVEFTDDMRTFWFDETEHAVQYIQRITGLNALSYHIRAALINAQPGYSHEFTDAGIRIEVIENKKDD